MVIRPNDTFKANWDILIMALALFNCFSVPFEVAYEPMSFQEPGFKTINFLIDFTFFIDILICFRTTFINDKGVEVSDGQEMALRYM